MSNEQSHHSHRRTHWVFIGFALIAGLLLFTEHRAHVLGLIPYLFLLACPLMHLFMHHGHGGHGDKNAETQNANGATSRGDDK